MKKETGSEVLAIHRAAFAVVGFSIAAVFALAGCDRHAQPQAELKPPFSEAAAESANDPPEALFKLARDGDVSAMAQLAAWCAQPMRDSVRERVMELLGKAANGGNSGAEYELGMIYGRAGPSEDLAKSEWWLTKAADHGNSDAEFGLGMKYGTGGFGFAEDKKKSVEWITRAANHGLTVAQHMLAIMYDTGDGVVKDTGKAVQWYRKAAEQGFPPAQSNLASAYYSGDGVVKDMAKAVEWNVKAAEQGDRAAINNLALMYQLGDGVPQNLPKAVEWNIRGARLGYMEAQYLLGRAYYKGEGVPKDFAKAAKWFLAAAVQGNRNGPVQVALMYARGQGIPKDIVLAYSWANVSASGDEGGARIRAELEPQLTAPELAEAQRISSAWSPGKQLLREGASSTVLPPAASAGPPAISESGTLFVVSASGQAITNQHVVHGCKEIRLKGREGLGKVLAEDSANDLALLQIPGKNFVVAPVAAEPSKLRQGQDISVYGFPLNSLLSAGGNFTPGVVSALTGLGNNTNQIQITAPIQPGSSGSPVLNKRAEVVAVVSMKLSDSKLAAATGSVGQNVSFAVSGQTLRAFLDANKIAYQSGAGFFARDRSSADAATEARRWTFVVECWK